MCCGNVSYHTRILNINVLMNIVNILNPATPWAPARSTGEAADAKVSPSLGIESWLKVIWSKKSRLTFWTVSFTLLLVVLFLFPRLRAWQKSGLIRILNISWSTTQVALPEMKLSILSKTKMGPEVRTVSYSVPSLSRCKLSPRISKLSEFY